MKSKVVAVVAAAGMILSIPALAQMPKIDPKPIGQGITDSVKKELTGTVKKIESAVNPQAQANLIPRSILFGNPERSGLKVSPNGKMVSFLAPDNGVMNVFVAPIGQLDKARVVTKDTSRGIRQYFWAYNSTHVLYLQDQGGDENWKLYAVDATKEGAAARDLTPIDTIAGEDGKPIMQPNGKPLRPTAEMMGASEKFPNTILVGLNNRDPRFHDIYKIDLSTGERTLYFTNPDFAQFEIDDDYNIRMGMKMLPSGGIDVQLAGATKPKAGGEVEITWTPYESIGFEDSSGTSFLAFDKTGSKVYVRDSRGRDTSALYEMDVATKAKKLIAESPKADMSSALIHPTNKNVQAVSFNHLRNEWTVVDQSIAGDLAYLKTVDDGEMNVLDRSLDDNTWVVAYARDNGPAKFYTYDRTAKKATFAFVNNSKLNGLPLVKMNPVVIKTRDGLEMVCYYSLPLGADANQDGKPEKAVPMVLNVHGGPWARDNWGYRGDHQWLANRGYAVLSVNFRGSTGFGKNFINAGNREWAGKMHDDLLDAVNWAVTQGIAQKDKVAIYGGSYGGYATLVGLTFTPDVFACGVDVVGPSSIVTLLNTIPPYWEPQIATFTQRVGDYRTEEGRKFLDSRSPLFKVDQIKKALLIGQGANDPRVKQSEADQIVNAMKSKNIPVTYVLFPDEGHGFARPANRKAFNAVVEAFLSKHLGGAYEPVGSDFEGSTISIPEGPEFVPGMESQTK
jgi:dipeptidyl aminopeptidase/acylaminoacyl peptidase